MPKHDKEVFGKFKKIVVAELNMGQFADYLRMKYNGFIYAQINKVQGLPFTINELKEKCIKLLEEK
jgi:2-oxoglutarate ferredoxin oxidoreductase subunit alpha